MAEPSATTPLLGDARQENGGEATDNQNKGWIAKNLKVRELVLFLWALLASAAVVVVAVWTQHKSQTHTPGLPAKRNLIFMVSDGMGPASLSLTRSFRQYVDGLPIDDTLVLDQHFWGTSRTRSTNSLVTDSAAGATAFSCGKKSYNGAISIIPPNYEPCGTVLEAAKRAGYTTGLVVTTDITDATPACFASHAVVRSLNNDIAVQEIGDGPLGRVVDLMLGGGRCHFLPNTTEGSCRFDDRDIVAQAKNDFGWNYINDRLGFDSLNAGEDVTLPLMGLFASRDIPFEIDRRNMNNVYPSLSEMAKTAIRALEKATENSDKGFFLMIEGSRIDHAAHNNDPASHVREILEYDRTFKSVLDFLEASSTEGVLVATSDHETGGLVTALQEPGQGPVYNWYPAVLANSNASAEYSALRLREHVAKLGANVEKVSLRNWINTNLVIQGLGITDARDSELDRLVASAQDATYVFSDMVSVRAHVGWTTHGHSAVDVNIYSSGGPRPAQLRGNVENTDVGKFLREYLEVDVDSITEELKDKLAQSADAEGLVASLGSEADHWAEHKVSFEDL
ncbi:unnamed protein product [Parascedosporium putredinis]|uniref:Alkaline phosphatase n=1 Tax=Parascedosporium putredinis TaxID=1442378 RepID=A0A9P1MFR7_9PEZI|nr:unnamed protein product [Parascedosporium putredinis]CAI8002972.1 unnamed protein product [Parascedosporium putredinis]